MRLIQQCLWRYKPFLPEIQKPDGETETMSKAHGGEINSSSRRPGLRTRPEPQRHFVLILIKYLPISRTPEQRELLFKGHTAHKDRQTNRRHLIVFTAWPTCFVSTYRGWKSMCCLMNCTHWLNSTNDAEDKAAQATCLVSTLLHGLGYWWLIDFIIPKAKRKRKHRKAVHVKPRIRVKFKWDLWTRVGD